MLRSVNGESSEDPRPKPPPPAKYDFMPYTAHTMAMIGGLALVFTCGITLFSGEWRWLVLGAMMAAVMLVGAYFRYQLDKNNAAAMRQRTTPPPNGWKGRGDGPQR